MAKKKTMLEQAQAAYKKGKKAQKKTKSHYGQVEKKTQSAGKQGEKNRKKSREQTKKVVSAVGSAAKSNVVKKSNNKPQAKVTTQSKPQGTRSGAIKPVNSRGNDRREATVTAHTSASNVRKSVSKAVNIHKGDTIANVANMKRKEGESKQDFLRRKYEASQKYNANGVLRQEQKTDTGYTDKDREKIATSTEQQLKDYYGKKYNRVKTFREQWNAEGGLGEQFEKINGRKATDEERKNYYKKYWKPDYTEQTEKLAKEQAQEIAKEQAPEKLYSKELSQNESAALRYYSRLVGKNKNGETTANAALKSLGALKYTTADLGKTKPDGTKVTKKDLGKVKTDKKGNIQYEQVAARDYQGNVAKDKNGKTVKVNRNVAEEVGSLTAAGANNAKFAVGFMQGSGVNNVLQSGVGEYNNAAKKVLSNVTESGAFNAGYMGGIAAQFMTAGTAKVAEGLMEQSAKAATKSAGKKFAQNRLVELGLETPLNFGDAVKMATDSDGKVDRKALATYMGLNSAMTVGMGGAIEGAGLGLTKLHSKEYIQLQAKALNKSITKEEIARLNVLQGKIDEAGRQLALAKSNIANKANYSATVADAVLKNGGSYDDAIKAMNGSTTNVQKMDFAKAIKDKAMTEFDDLRVKRAETLTKIESASPEEAVKLRQKATELKADMDRLANVANGADRQLVIAEKKNRKALQDLTDSVGKMSETTGVKYRVLNDADMRKAIAEAGEDVSDEYFYKGFYYTNKDGQTEILINSESPQAHQTVIGHETGHLIKASSEEEFGELGNMLEEYARKKGDFESIEKQLKRSYPEATEAQLREEVTCELIGRYVYGMDDAFIKRLAGERPSTFRRIIDYFKQLFDSTTNKEMRAELKAIMDKVDDAVKKIEANDKEAKFSKDFDSQVERAIEDDVVAEVDKEIQSITQHKELINHITDDNGNITREANMEYGDAVKRGDMETAQKYVDAALESKGYTIEMYHGSDDFGFTQFDLGEMQKRDKKNDRLAVFLSSKHDVAASYTMNNKIRNLVEKDLDRETLSKLIKVASPSVRDGDDLLDSLSLSPVRDALHDWQEDYKNYNGDVQSPRLYIEERIEDARADGAMAGLDISKEKLDEIYKLADKIGESVQKGGVYRGKGKLEKPLVVDAQGRNWSRLPVEDDAVLRNIAEADIKWLKENRAKEVEQLKAAVKSGENTKIDFGEYQILVEHLDNGKVQCARIKPETFKKYGYAEDIVEFPKSTFDNGNIVAVLKDDNMPYGGQDVFNTREWVNYALNQGDYDGVIFKNVYDPGEWADVHLRTNGFQSSDVYVLFDSNQFKVADPVTRDNNGNIIPLSERGNEKSPDFRFSKERKPNGAFNTRELSQYKDAKTYDEFVDKNFDLLKDNYKSFGKTKYGGDEMEEIWRMKRSESLKSSAKELNDGEVIDIIRNGVKESHLAGWFRNGDSGYKPRIAEQILGSDDVLNAAWNVMYRHYKELNGSDISFDEFLNTPVALFRGEHGQGKVSDDIFNAYSFDEKMAEHFTNGKQDMIDTLEIKPIDTWGSYMTTAEAEVLVPEYHLANAKFSKEKRMSTSQKKAQKVERLQSEIDQFEGEIKDNKAKISAIDEKGVGGVSSVKAEKQLAERNKTLHETESLQKKVDARQEEIDKTKLIKAQREAKKNPQTAKIKPQTGETAKAKESTATTKKDAEKRLEELNAKSKKIGLTKYEEQEARKLQKELGNIKDEKSSLQKVSESEYSSDELKSAIADIEKAGVNKEAAEKEAKRFNELGGKVAAQLKHIENAKKSEKYATEAERMARVAELEDELAVLKSKQAKAAGKIEQLGKMKAVDDSITAKEQIRRDRGQKSVNKEVKNNDKLKNEDKWITDKWNSIRRLFEDSLIDVENVAKRTGDKTLREQILTAANRVRNSANMANNWITKARRSFDNKVGGKSLDEIFAKDLIENEAKYADFQEYLIMKHVPARHAKGTDIYPEVSPELAAKRVAELEEQYGDELTNWADDVYGYLKDLQQYRVDSGMLSQEAADQFAKDYPFYVPTNRARDDEAIDFFTGGLSNQIRTAKGGENDVLDMYSQLYTATNKTIHAAEENQMLNLYFRGKGITEAELKGYEQGDLEHAVIEANVNKKTGASTVSFFVDGAPVKLPCSHQLALGLRELDGLEFERLMKAAKVATLYGRPFKALITDWNIVFGVRNGMRDMQQAVVNSKDTRYFGSSFGAAAHSVAHEDSPYRKLYSSMGGEQAQLVSYDAVTKAMGIEKQSGKIDAIHEKTQDIVDAQIGGKHVNVIHYIEAANGAIEMMPRMCEFIGTLRKAANSELKKQGSSLKKLREQIIDEVTNDDSIGKTLKKDEIENRLAERVIELAGKDSIDTAMRNANDITLNFGRSGVIGKALNMGFVPYLNPSIQGLSKLVRLFTEAGGEGGFKALTSIGIKLGTFTIAPAVFNEVMLRNNEEYQNLNTRDKDNNFFISLGDGKFIKIPKPRENAVLAEPVEYGLRYFFDDAEYAFFDWDKLSMKTEHFWEKIPLTDEGKQFFRTAVDNIGVINPATSNMFSPLMQTANNKTWYGGSIESAYEMENKDSKDRYDTGTSAIAIQLGQLKGAQFFNLSPKKIDNLLDSYTGMIYDLYISQTTEEAKTRGNYFVRTLASQFMKDSVFSNKLSTKAWAKIDGMSEEKAQKYKSKYMYDTYKYDDAMDLITADKNMTNAEKMAAKRELQKQKNKINRAAIDGTENKSNPLVDISKFLGANRTLNNFLPDSGDKQYDTWTDYYKNYKKTKGYKSLTAKQKEKEAQKFLDVYTLGVRGQSKVSGDFHDSPSWGMTGVAAAQLASNKKLSKKDATTIMIACGVYESQTPVYYKYSDHGGNVSRYAVTQRNLDKTFDKLEDWGMNTKSGLWKGSFSDMGAKGGTIAMSLATGKADFKDRAYYIANSSDENCLIKMNAARGFAEKYGHKTKEISKLAQKADKLGDGNTYLKNDEIVTVCNQMKGNSEEKSMAYILLGGNPKKNPFGAIGDYSHDGDTGITADGEDSGGRGRRGRRGWGHRGGGGGGGSKGTMPTTASGAITGKVTDPFGGSNTSSKSNLNDAYRKKAKRLREQSRK